MTSSPGPVLLLQRTLHAISMDVGGKWHKESLQKEEMFLLRMPPLYPLYGKQSSQVRNLLFLKGMEWRNWEDFLKATEENGSMKTWLWRHSSKWKWPIWNTEFPSLHMPDTFSVLLFFFVVVFFLWSMITKSIFHYHLYRPALQRPCTHYQETS